MVLSTFTELCNHHPDFRTFSSLKKKPAALRLHLLSATPSPALSNYCLLQEDLKEVMGVE